MPVAFERDERRVDRRDARLDQVDVADEARDPARIRPLVDLDRRPDLREPAADPSRAMRSATVIASSWSCVTMTKRGLQPRLQLLQLEARLLAQLAVERGERLVEQQHLRPLGERARERDALALPAGELVDLARRRIRRAAPAPASRRPARRSRPSAGRPASARTPHCRRPSGAETARSSGTSCSPAADRAARRQGPAPASSTRPASGVSKPASRRSSVVLPQPEGPSSAKNSRSWISRVRPSTAVKSPKRFVTCSKVTSAAMAAR